MVAFDWFVKLVGVAVTAALLAAGPAFADTRARVEAAGSRRGALDYERRGYHDPRKHYGGELPSQIRSRRAVGRYSVGEIVSELEGRGLFSKMKEKMKAKKEKFQEWRGERKEKKEKKKAEKQAKKDAKKAKKEEEKQKKVLDKMAKEGKGPKGGHVTVVEDAKNAVEAKGAAEVEQMKDVTRTQDLDKKMDDGKGAASAKKADGMESLEDAGVLGDEENNQDSENAGTGETQQENESTQAVGLTARQCKPPTRHHRMPELLNWQKVVHKCEKCHCEAMRVDLTPYGQSDPKLYCYQCIKFKIPTWL